MATTKHPFSNLVVQALTQHITAYQWGNQPPISPKQFQENLIEEAKAYGINWSDSLIGNEHQQIVSAVITYAIFYQELLTRPEPSNPTDEFHAWFEEAHK